MYVLSDTHYKNVVQLQKRELHFRYLLSAGTDITIINATIDFITVTTTSLTKISQSCLSSKIISIYFSHLFVYIYSS